MQAATIVLNNNTLQNIQLINLRNGNNNNNKLEYETDTDTDKPVNLSVPEFGRRRFSKSEGQENKFRSQKMLLRRPNGECLPFNSELHKRRQTTAPRGGRNWKGITG
jgi:hypothetical protein